MSTVEQRKQRQEETGSRSVHVKLKPRQVAITSQALAHWTVPVGLEPVASAQSRGGSCKESMEIVTVMIIATRISFVPCHGLNRFTALQNQAVLSKSETLIHRDY